jgi:hypothetical protein
MDMRADAIAMPAILSWAMCGKPKWPTGHAIEKNAGSKRGAAKRSKGRAEESRFEMSEGKTPAVVESPCQVGTLVNTESEVCGGRPKVLHSKSFLVIQSSSGRMASSTAFVSRR